MNTIIAGRFDAQAGAERAVTALEATGFPRDQIATFFVNRAGQHDLHGTRRDPEASAGAHHAGAGAAAGALGGTGVGTVVGLATMPVLGPVGPLAGAAIGGYVGSLVGALEKMGDPEPLVQESAHTEASNDEGLPRKSGMLVAVGAASSSEQASAIAVLRAQGASDMERARGNITQSQWNDFDPLSTPALVTVER
jgi:phage tail tape-measure protein